MTDGKARVTADEERVRSHGRAV